MDAGVSTRSKQARKIARRVVKPVVGDSVWAAGRKIDRTVREQLQQRQQRAEQARKDAEQARKDAEWQVTSRNLTALAQHFRTDKFGTHKYTPHYQFHFETMRERPIRLLEIGIGGYNRPGAGGASLRMWKHFFPQAQIVGLDIQDKSFVEEDRIKVYQGDQTDPDLLARINAEYGPFDIIIDDGSHQVRHILATFEVLYPMLKDGGIYVIEDIQTSYWPAFGGSQDVDSPDTSMALAKRLADSLNYEEFMDDDYEPTYLDLNVVGLHFYHNLVLIEKGKNAEGTNRRRIKANRTTTTSVNPAAAAPVPAPPAAVSDLNQA